jgi:bifunctional DNA-binding transcriptional regulator/antitoxin component of YhaV-PrlF toxin-antitoxin module
MVLRRQLLARKGQLLLAVPAEVRKLLGVGVGSGVYWHVTRKGEAVVATRPTRGAGRGFDPDQARELERARQELVKLRARVTARPLRVFNEGYAQGRQAHMGELVKLTAAQRVLLAELRELADVVAQLAAWVRAPGALRGPRRRRSRPVEPVPAPVLSAPGAAAGAGTEGDAAPG